MELTGKCKEDFEKWYNESFGEYGSDDGKMPSLNGIPYECTGFNNYSKSMQYGVFVDFFDTHIIRIGDYCIIQNEAIYYESNVNGYLGGWKTRHEARTEAIKKANEIYNQNK